MTGQFPHAARYVLWLAFTLALNAMPGVSSADEKAAQAQEESATPEELAERAIRQALEQPVTADFDTVPLTQAIRRLTERHQLKPVFDLGALADAGLDPNMPVTIKLADIPLRTALRHVLKEFDLTWIVQDGVLLITSVDEAGTILKTQVYDVIDLFPQTPGNEAGTIPPGGPNLEPLMDVIRSIVFPQTWSEVGGPGTMKGFNGMLVISQTEETHRLVEKLLAELRRAQARRKQTSATE